MTLSPRLARLRSLRGDTSGLALLEFAFTLPIVLAMGGWGVELSFLALSNLRVSQYAVNLADNASRVGIAGNAGVTQLREVDINDVLDGTRTESEIIKLTANGRVTLSSLENVRQWYDSGRVQRIHWQRCIGTKSGIGFDSTFGSTGPNAGKTDTAADAGTTMPNGMGFAGPPDRRVEAFRDSGVMFVEINFQYKPLFGSMFVKPQIIHYTQSYVVRDNRDFTRIYNDVTSPAPVSSCDKYPA